MISQNGYTVQSNMNRITIATNHSTVFPFEEIKRVYPNTLITFRLETTHISTQGQLVEFYDEEQLHNKESFHTDSHGIRSVLRAVRRASLRHTQLINATNIRTMIYLATETKTNPLQLDNQHHIEQAIQRTLAKLSPDNQRTLIQELRQEFYIPEKYTSLRDITIYVFNPYNSNLIEQLASPALQIIKIEIALGYAKEYISQNQNQHVLLLLNLIPVEFNTVLDNVYERLDMATEYIDETVKTFNDEGITIDPEDLTCLFFSQRISPQNET